LAGGDLGANVATVFLGVSGGTFGGKVEGADVTTVVAVTDVMGTDIGESTSSFSF
jgi:hypothetical protein